MQKYALVDKGTGEETEANADMVERVTGVRSARLTGVSSKMENLENGEWEVRVSKRGW